MPFDNFAAFIVACLVLAIMPGPNVALIVTNAIHFGRKAGLLTVAGTSCAMILQLSVVVLGLSVVLECTEEWFEVLRWIGVGYLVFLGIQAWRAPSVDLNAVAPRQPAVFFRGVLVSLTNPKTLLFLGAFLPQFVSVKADASAQLALLSFSFLVVMASVDVMWALLAARARAPLASFGRMTNRITGATLIAAGVGLALSRRP